MVINTTKVFYLKIYWKDEVINFDNNVRLKQLKLRAKVLKGNIEKFKKKEQQLINCYQGKVVNEGLLASRLLNMKDYIGKLEKQLKVVNKNIYNIETMNAYNINKG